MNSNDINAFMNLINNTEVPKERRYDYHSSKVNSLMEEVVMRDEIEKGLNYMTYAAKKRIRKICRKER